MNNKMKMQYKFWDNYPEFYDTETGVPYSRPMQLYLIAKREYYRGTPIMTDHTFDAFEVAIKNKFPDCPALEVVGEPTLDDAKNVGDWVHSKRFGTAPTR